MPKVLATFKIDAKLKRDAQNLANSLGLPLTAIVTHTLEQFVRQKSYYFGDTTLSKEAAEAVAKVFIEYETGDYRPTK